MALHVVLGGLYLLFAPFQFVKRIRSRHPGYHRRMGRVLVAAGMAVGATAIFVGLAIPFSGRAESVLIVSPPFLGRAEAPSWVNRAG